MGVVAQFRFSPEARLDCPQRLGDEARFDGRSRIDRELYVYTEDDIGNQTALFCLPDSFDPRSKAGR